MQYRSHVRKANNLKIDTATVYIVIFSRVSRTPSLHLCCGIAYKGCRLFGTTSGGGFRPLYRGRFLGGLATPYVVHSSKVCEMGGHDSDER